MAAEAEILDELRRLRARMPQLTGALAASVDGLVLAHDTPGVEPEGVAALTAAALGIAVRTTDVTGRGELRELLLRGRYGYIATYAAGATAVLTLLAPDGVSVGRLHLEGRRSGARIGEFMAAAAPVPVPPAARTAPRSTARLPTRFTGSARTTTTTETSRPTDTPRSTEVHRDPPNR